MSLSRGAKQLHIMKGPSSAILKNCCQVNLDLMLEKAVSPASFRTEMDSVSIETL